VRLSDFKSNEYAELLGGHGFEPDEENPMIGLRGASRYYSDFYRDAFALECVALKYLREKMGFDNVTIMVPFCRSPEEADRVIEVMAEHGLERGKNGLQLYVMTEIPSNVIRAEEFAERFDGFSIGSNDLTQLTLGVDRDSGELSELFKERDPAVLWMIEQAIAKAHATGSKIGLCGQAPSNDPEFAKLLVKAGIHSISVTPDSFLDVKRNVAAAEAEVTDISVCSNRCRARSRRISMKYFLGEVLRYLPKSRSNCRVEIPRPAAIFDGDTGSSIWPRICSMAEARCGLRMPARDWSETRCALVASRTAL
jgi:pyruvate,water dikinase